MYNISYSSCFARHLFVILYLEPICFEGIAKAILRLINMRFWFIILHENALNLFGFGAFFFLLGQGPVLHCGVFR